MREIRLLDAAFDPHSSLAALSEQTPEAGGIATFIGKVRASGGVEALELSHYEPLTLGGMMELASQAEGRFELVGLVILHRTGTMAPGDPIVCVAAAAVHRRDAILAVDFCMDHLKSAAWFWKREKRRGVWHWIEPRNADHADLARWEG
jgi:molybdopterin synthase catalytic subunit